MNRAIALRMAKAGLLRKTVAKISPIMSFEMSTLREFPGTGNIVYGKTEYRAATPREVRIALREQRAGRDWRFAI